MSAKYRIVRDKNNLPTGECPHVHLKWIGQFTCIDLCNYYVAEESNDKFISCSNRFAKPKTKHFNLRQQ